MAEVFMLDENKAKWCVMSGLNPKICVITVYDKMCRHTGERFCMSTDVDHDHIYDHILFTDYVQIWTIYLWNGLGNL